MSGIMDTRTSVVALMKATAAVVIASAAIALSPSPVTAAERYPCFNAMQVAGSCRGPLGRGGEAEYTISSAGMDLPNDDDIICADLILDAGGGVEEGPGWGYAVNGPVCDLIAYDAIGDIRFQQFTSELSDGEATACAADLAAAAAILVIDPIVLP